METNSPEIKIGPIRVATCSDWNDEHKEWDIFPRFTIIRSENVEAVGIGWLLWGILFYKLK